MVMCGAQITFRIVSSGEWKSFSTLARLGSPSAFRTEDGSATARATTSRTALWLRSSACAARQSAMKRSSMPLVYGELAQQAPRQALARHGAVLAGHPHAVDPDAMNPHRARGQARVAARKVEYAALGPAVHGRGVEEQEIGVVPDLERAALLDAEERGRLAGEAPHRVGEREHAELAHPVPEKMQAEAGVVEEREMRARVRQRHQAARVLEHAADRGFVGVEQERAVHRVEVLLERRVQHEIERILARGARELRDRLLLELAPRRLDHLHQLPLAVEEPEMRRLRDLRAQRVAKRFCFQLALELLSFQGQRGLPRLQALEDVRRVQRELHGERAARHGANQPVAAPVRLLDLLEIMKNRVGVGAAVKQRG